DGRGLGPATPRERLHRYDGAVAVRPLRAPRIVRRATNAGSFLGLLRPHRSNERMPSSAGRCMARSNSRSQIRAHGLSCMSGTTSSILEPGATGVGTPEIGNIVCMHSL